MPASDGCCCVAEVVRGARTSSFAMSIASKASLADRNRWTWVWTSSSASQPRNVIALDKSQSISHDKVKDPFLFTYRLHLRTDTPVSTVPYIVTLLPLPASLDAPLGPAQAAHSRRGNSTGRHISNRFTGDPTAHCRVHYRCRYFSRKRERGPDANGQIAPHALRHGRAISHI